MSELFRRLAQLHETGHARNDLALAEDMRHAPDITFRSAAVLAAVTERERPGILMIHRPSNMRAHPGQVALPGGKIDAGETPVEAALREAWEELGIPPGRVRIVGEGDAYFTRTGFEITPVVGVVPPDLELTPNPAEVAQWFEAPLDFVLDPQNHVQVAVEINGMQRSYWEVHWHEHRIWGVTAGLLVNLSRRLGWA